MMSGKSIFLLILVCFTLNACRTHAPQTGNTSGQAETKTRENPVGLYTLTFNKYSHGVADTLKGSLLNNSDSAVAIALRCGHYLELSFQQSVNGVWSENKQPSYMRLRCATHTFTINPHGQYDFSLPTSLFGTPGVFRLLVSFTTGTGNTNHTLTSDAFEL
jgi:hypothetical protein